MRTFTEIPVLSTFLVFFSANSTSFWKGIEIFHTHLPAINDAGGSGYYFITPSATPGGVSAVTMGLLFANVSDDAWANKTLGQTVAELTSLLGEASVIFQHQVIPESKYLFSDALIPGNADNTGTISRVASRLVSHDFLSSPGGPSRLTSALEQIAAKLQGSFTGHVVAGGQVSRNKVDNAVNPAWRKTLTHIAFGAGWNSSSSWEEQKAASDRLTNEAVPLIKVLEPDMGAYLNEADVNEVDYQKSFWGSNYERLFKLKKKLDPRGLFITSRGVGSEEWDEEGLCRLK